MVLIQNLVSYAHSIAKFAAIDAPAIARRWAGDSVDGVFSDGEVFIRNMYIAEYENGSYNNHKPRIDRKLLLNAKEIVKIEKFLKTKGNALIPVKLFLSDKGWLKLLIACATGKKTHDKRQDLKLKDDKREMDRTVKRGV